jgi:hypothetical protein
VPEEQQKLTRADLPEEFTPEAVRRLPMSTLRRLAKPGNGILRPEEQASFNDVLREVMTETARRVSGQINRPDWDTVLREANGRGGRRRRPGRSSGVDEHLSRLARRIDQQVGAAEALAPGVDWSFAQPAAVPAPATIESADTADTSRTTDTAQPTDTAGTADTTSGDAETVSDLEQRLTEQVELVQVMSEIADVSKRTYELEQQRDLQSTRTVFFGFVVSVAVLVAGWAPIVAADDWHERIWILCLTVGTCAAAGAVYALIRKRQNAQLAKAEDQQQSD